MLKGGDGDRYVSTGMLCAQVGHVQHHQVGRILRGSDLDMYRQSHIAKYA